MAKAIFHPQMWVNDHAIEVDSTGPNIWDIGAIDESILDDSYESDELRFHENAPQWVQDWPGPFYIEINRN